MRATASSRLAAFLVKENALFTRLPSFTCRPYSFRQSGQLREHLHCPLHFLTFPLRYYLQSRAKNNRRCLLGAFVCLMETHHPLTAASEQPRNSLHKRHLFLVYKQSIRLLDLQVLRFSSFSH